MISRLYGDDVSAEIWPQQETEGFNHIWSLWLATRKIELGELFVRSQHHQLWTKHNMSCFLLVVVDLYGCIVGYSEGDNLRLLSLDVG